MSFDSFQLCVKYSYDFNNYFSSKNTFSKSLSWHSKMINQNWEVYLPHEKGKWNPEFQTVESV